MMQHLAIIELGSNSLRLSINRVHFDGSYREVKRCRKGCRLAAQINADGILQPTAVRQSIRILRDFKNVYRAYSSVKVIGIATAAVRQAKNRQAFLQKIKDQTGIGVHVLSGVQEADCDYLGLKDQVRFPRYLIMDVGGGSIELISVHDDQRDLVSLPFGAISLSQRFNLQDRVSGQDWFDAMQFFEKKLLDVTWINEVHPHIPIVLIGGAHRSLIQMICQAGQVSRARLSGDRINPAQILKIYDRLLADNLEQRRQTAGLEAKRADVIVGGLLPVVFMVDHFRPRTIRFSERGVRDGLIHKMLTDR